MEPLDQQTIDAAIAEHLELLRLYGGQYVVHRGLEVLAHGATYDEIADWLNCHRPIPDGAVIEWLPPTDVVIL